jgi:hypothetical protein
VQRFPILSLSAIPPTVRKGLIVKLDTVSIGGIMCRVFEGESGCVAVVTPYGRVFGYPNGTAFMSGESDYDSAVQWPASVAESFAKSYAGGESFCEACAMLEHEDREMSDVEVEAATCLCGDCEAFFGLGEVK